MIRTKKPAILKENLFGEENIPDAIFTADWHLRDTTPACRQESEFEKAQWKKVAFISELQKKYKCPVIHAGDLFHHWKPSPYLLSLTLQNLPNDFYTIYGNHDLPQHNLDLEYKSGIHVLQCAKKLYVLDGEHWGQDYVKVSIEIKQRKILVWHVMTYQGKKPYPGCTDPMSVALLRKNTIPDVILTGHNHQSFVEEYKGRILINPGCITRQESDQVTFKPRIFLYFAKTNTVKPVYLPIEEDVVTKPENVQNIEERNERLEAFISKLNTDWDMSLDFPRNLERFMKVNKTDSVTKQIVIKALE